MADQKDREKRKGKGQSTFVPGVFVKDQQCCYGRPDELSGPREDSSSDLLYANDGLENKDFGRDTNRLDYFSLTTIDVHGNQGASEIPSYGSGGGSQIRRKSFVGVRRLGWWNKIKKCWGR
ncbi:hypothetical protein QVD17_09531 [Tagetes erecta]|uniref:Uncharacterized protein n=1 Tax=Tagetes erecta TaxID=13708 RepID=A0AAD8P416_TARER|nr:hypothetical protein QVD17_09531 [Tagetes erecta]